MDEKTVVSNSTPLINFANIGQLEILQVLFGRIVIPEAVWEEIVVKGSNYPPSQLIKDLRWISRKDITSRELYDILECELDKGEAEAIILAGDLKADLVLLDETEARGYAERQGLFYMGSIGVLTLAKKSGVIPKVKPLLDEMINRADFWISKNLYNAVLKDNREF